MTDGFNLRALVREVCDESHQADPAMLAKEVDRRIRKADRDAALEQALAAFMWQFVSRDRSSVATSRPGAVSGRSSKVAGIRGLARAQRDRVSVGPDPSDWKFLADCTADDLDYAAALREEYAQRVMARADQYRRLAELLAEHGVATVGELPQPVLGDELGDDAA